VQGLGFRVGTSRDSAPATPGPVGQIHEIVGREKDVGFAFLRPPLKVVMLRKYCCGSTHPSPTNTAPRDRPPLCSPPSCAKRVLSNALGSAPRMIFCSSGDVTKFQHCQDGIPTFTICTILKRIVATSLPTTAATAPERNFLFHSVRSQKGTNLAWRAAPSSSPRRRSL